MNDTTAIFPRPPSAYHDQAFRRDADHDIMQQKFLAFLRQRPLAGIPYGAAVHREVEGERPIYRNGQAISFIDACEVVTINLTTVVNLFEIKPKIATVFGIIRQAKSQLALAKLFIPADHHYCHVVVPYNDPLISELKAEWPHVWAWGFK